MSDASFFCQGSACNLGLRCACFLRGRQRGHCLRPVGSFHNAAMRIASFNVHYFTNRSLVPSQEPMAEFLRALSCDAIVLQEVPEDQRELNEIASALGMHARFAPASELGNALLSRQPPLWFSVERLQAGTSEARSVFAAGLSWAGGICSLFGTHLDPLSEATRMAQLGQLLAWLRQHDRQGLTLLAGDFNSLCLDDYDAASLARIHAHRQAGGIDPPEFAVTAHLRTSGFVDLWRAASATKARLAATAEQAESELATCWAGTRIDYLWAAADLAQHARLLDCRHVATTTSDHSLVVADFDAAAAFPGAAILEDV